MTADLVLDARALLGEGAIWNYAEKKLYWVDIEGGVFHVFDPVTRQDSAYDVGKRIGTVVPCGHQQALIAAEDGLAVVSLPHGDIEYRLNTTIHQDGMRFNDGKCDKHGRFWVGSKALDDTPNSGVLYCVHPDLTITEKITGVTISNGIVWSNDNKAMYYIDTPTQTVVRYDYDADTGHISDGKVVIEVPEGSGYPDGMTIDSEGKLWIALWDGFCVARFDPETGELLEKVSVPAPKVTSCAFGGDNLDVLYITTARVDMTEEELQMYPYSGGVFAVNTKVSGVMANDFSF